MAHFALRANRNDLLQHESSEGGGNIRDYEPELTGSHRLLVEGQVVSRPAREEGIMKILLWNVEIMPVRPSSNKTQLT
jgi:hypothetical protein